MTDLMLMLTSYPLAPTTVIELNFITGLSVDESGIVRSACRLLVNTDRGNAITKDHSQVWRHSLHTHQGAS